MFTYTKFFDAQVAEPPAGGAAPSIAALMAKSGTLSTGNEGVIPSINIETKNEPTPAKEPAPAIANAAKESGTASSNPPIEAKPTATPQTEPVVSQPSWQEVLKTQQPDTIFKELGYGEPLAKFLNGRKDIDPKMLSLIDHWEKNNGDIKPYLAALSTDFGKMPPEEVMRHHLREQYPELDAKQLDRLYKLKVVDRYKLDPQNYSEEEVADGQIELLADVKEVRNKLIQSQTDFLLPKPEPKTAEAEQFEQQRKADFEAYRSQLTDDPYTKKIFENKKLTIGEGDDAYSADIDPQSVVDSLLNPDKWVSNFYTAVTKPDGKVEYQPDIEKQILIASFAKDPKGFLKDYAKYFKSLGGKSAIESIDNAKPVTTTATAHAEVETSNPAAAAAKRGKLTRGGE